MKLTGIDHSLEMIKLAQSINSKAISEKRLTLLEASVTSIPFADNSVDIVTAFETIQFWPEIDKAFDEINRILADEGRFLIINRFPKEDSKWWKMATLKSVKDYEEIFSHHGFDHVEIDLNFKRGWIVVLGKLR